MRDEKRRRMHNLCLCAMWSSVGSQFNSRFSTFAMPSGWSCDASVKERTNEQRKHTKKANKRNNDSSLSRKWINFPCLFRFWFHLYVLRSVCRWPRIRRIKNEIEFMRFLSSEPTRIIGVANKGHRKCESILEFPFYMRVLAQRLSAATTTTNSTSLFSGKLKHEAEDNGCSAANHMQKSEHATQEKRHWNRWQINIDHFAIQTIGVFVRLNASRNALSVVFYWFLLFEWSVIQ